MARRIARTGHLLAAGTLLASLGAGSVAHAAQPARPQATTTYTIGVSLPYLQLAELANGIRTGVQVAIDQANKNHTVPGVKFALSSKDDTVNLKYDGAKDADNARAFVNDPTVIGEVGPLNSGAAQVSEPVYNANGLVQISPANTNPDLTLKRALYEPTSAKTGSPITYFRTCTTDAYQGPSAALYAKKIGVKSVYVTDNQDTYGVGLANSFKGEAQKIGLKVLGYGELDINSMASSAQSLATAIARTHPDLVYFGGEYGAKGGAEFLAGDLKKVGLSKTLFMGGDGIYAGDFIKGPAEYGALATSVGGDPSKDPNATAFLKAEKPYLKKGATVAAYDTYAYDAAGVLIRGFAKAVKDGKIKVGAHMTKANRLIVARAVAATKDYHGATGNFSFDKNGDTTNHVIGVYKVSNKGAWGFIAIAPKL